MLTIQQQAENHQQAFNLFAVVFSFVQLPSYPAAYFSRAQHKTEHNGKPLQDVVKRHKMDQGDHLPSGRLRRRSPTAIASISIPQVCEGLYQNKEIGVA
jgi:hypothetical protein